MTLRFYESQHHTIHVSDNPYKMSCGRKLKKGKPLGQKLDEAKLGVPGEPGIFRGAVFFRGYYLCPDCRGKHVKMCKIEEYWVEIDGQP